MLREAGKLQVWGYVILIFEMDQNWNQLDLRKAVQILKIVVQFFYYTSNPSIFKLIKLIDLLQQVNFLVIKTFSNIFRSTFCCGRQHLNIFYMPFIFCYCQQVLFTLGVSSLLSPLNDASVDFADDMSSFQFSPEAQFTSPLYFYMTLATDTEAKSLCFPQVLRC